VKLSRFFNISQVAVGFLLLSVATSLPELSVSVASSSLGEGAISAGNVFGSNIANILVILGFGGFIYGMKVSHPRLKEIALVLVLTTLISVYIIFSSSVQGRALGLMEGAALLAIFAGYVLWILKRKSVNNGIKHKITKGNALKAFLSFSIGILLVIVSSGFVVDSAVSLAYGLGLAQSFIGATIIALGTSLPELSTTLQALRNKHFGLVLGNTIGSNMTNITFVLGLASVINPIQVQLPVFIAALLFAVVANTILFYSAAINRSIGKVSGALYLLLYVVFVFAILGLQASELGAV
jgi:cation:H+ antiporter